MPICHPICDLYQIASTWNLKCGWNTRFLSHYRRNIQAWLGIILVAILYSDFTYSNDDALSQSNRKSKNDEILIAPKIERQQIHIPDHQNITLQGSVYGGLFKLEGFETELLIGSRFAIHPLDWLFISAEYGVSQSDESARTEVGFQPVFQQDRLSLYNASIGLQVAQSQLVLAGATPRSVSTSGYLSIGAGRIDADLSSQQENAELNALVLGMGFTMLLNKRLLIHSDVRDHVIEEALLDRDNIGHNIEFRIGLGMYY